MLVPLRYMYESLGSCQADFIPEPGAYTCTQDPQFEKIDWREA